MTPLRKIFGPLSTLFFLGAILTLLLTILTGATETSILKKFYWLQTDCSGFSGANINGLCRWTNYGFCAVDNNDNTNCTSNSAAFPLDPARTFSNTDGLPSAFQHRNNYYYYTSRIGYGFQLVSVAFLFFSFIAFFVFWFVDNKYAQISLWTLMALTTLFLIPGVALSTSAYVKGRNIFTDAGLPSKVGVKPMALAWTTVALVILLWVFLFLMTKSTESFKVKRTYSNGWFKRKDIPPQSQMVAVTEPRYDEPELITTNPNTTASTANKISNATDGTI